MLEPTTAPRHGYADLGEVRLHYVEAGEGPLVILLHGFPEFWYSWRHQIPALVTAGFRVVAPDMRGYNLSSKPSEVADYHIDKLASDVSALIRERGERSAFVAGHDWGAAVAWHLAMLDPDVVQRLAILNAPHPRRFVHGINHPAQLLRSWYMFFYQLPWLPEVTLRRWLPVLCPFERALGPDRFSPEDLTEYKKAWALPGVVPAMLAYYRAGFADTAAAILARIRPIHSPTLVIWGESDHYLRTQLAEPSRDDVPGLERVERLPDASHWVHQHAPQRVSQLLIEFFTPAEVARAAE
jgi:pimeloyl-ACP methyl ester carboxylesterase